jgi:multiple sugar transport system ATP-binding protein
LSSVRIDGVAKSFGLTPVLDGLSLGVADGEFLTLLGPSGSGKTTLLRIIAGLIVPDAGSVFFGERLVTRLPPNKRNVAMVFQDYALYPNMRVRDNIAFGLRMRKMPRDDIAQRVQAVSRTLGIEPLLGRWPQELSGGQKQRVALGRAIVRKPDVFLLDEPLSNLDAQLRIAMRAELQKIHRGLEVTMIHVTHDQEEAMSVSQRIALINNGQVEQQGTPQELYRNPMNVFVARFVGAPSINILPCRVLREAECWRIVGSSFSMTISSGGFSPARDTDLNKVLVGIRPEDLTLADQASPNVLSGEVSVVERLGKEAVIYVATGGREEIIVRTVTDEVPGVGERIYVTVKETDLYFFDGQSGRALLSHPK